MKRILLSIKFERFNNSFLTWLSCRAAHNRSKRNDSMNVPITALELKLDVNVFSHASCKEIDKLVSIEVVPL